MFVVVVVCSKQVRYLQRIPLPHLFLRVCRCRQLCQLHKQHLKCRQVSTRGFTTLELQVFVLILPCPFLRAVIYRPPKLKNDFLNEFSELLFEFTHLLDDILIRGD